MNDFGFYDDFGGEYVLRDEIEISSDENASFLISNSPKLKAQVVANEINFYLQNSADDTLQKAKNTLLLYEIRANEFDMSKDIDYEKAVGKNVLLVSNDALDGLADKLRANGYKVISLTHFEVKFTYGSVGELSSIILQNGEEIEVEHDFLLANNAQNFMLKQSGCIEINELNDDEILDYLNLHSPNYGYKNYVTYDENICQYHHRRQEICAKCVVACPTTAIMKDDEKKELVFSQIDFTNDGESVGVCPSGALDLSALPFESFEQSTKMYKNKIAFILSDSLNFASLKVNLPQNVLPFALPNLGFLSHTHLLTLLQESGANIVIYADSKAKNLLNSAVNLINEIYERKFHKKAIFVADDDEILQECLNFAKLDDDFYFDFNSYKMSKREIFGKRLAHIIADDDLGEVATDDIISYGEVLIDTNSCTLCLSCVGACNVGALVADNSTNSIRFNPSLCTACGYCETNCAEKDTLEFRPSGIALNKGFTEYKELAHDELFKCIECGKEFATTKAIERIASVMKPVFADNPDKLKTLYCCADCKAKLMFVAQIKNGDYL